MSELIRTDTVFGKRANIVGNISADLVLESLGNVYIKSRNSAKTLEEVIKSLVSDDLNTTSSKILIIDGLEEAGDLKDGLLVYDKSSLILYLTLDGQLIELINVTPEGTGFVKRSGDTMTGKLSILVPNGPPLYVNSTELVQNLNANYLQGETAKNFTRRAVNEIITGSWKFLAPTLFGANTLFSLDAVINGSLGSSDFAGGFGGYGWRLEASTNTLTIDNLVVRKLMKVYELVVNRISATNGSLWVSNAGKVYKAEPLLIVSNIAGLSINLDEILTAYSEEFTQITGFNKGLKFVIVTDPSTVTLTTNDVMSSEGRAMITPESVYSTASRRTMRLITIKDPELLYKYAVDDNVVEAAVDFTNVYYGKTEEEIAAMQELTAENNEYSPNNMDILSNEAFYSLLLFDPDFKFDVTLPIIPKTYNLAFEISEEYRKQSLKEHDANKTSKVAEAKQAINTIGITLFDTKLSSDFLSPNDVIVCTKPYYKYFCNGDFYYIELNNEFLPTLAVGDLLRCLKWTYGGIKYYDAIVCAHLGAYSFIILLGNSFQDNNSRIYYDNDTLQTKVERNTEMYNTSLIKATDPFGTVEKDDSLVLIGNLWDTQRLNAVYITSTDDGAPYLDVLAGINRPDYSVIYYVPLFNTIKLNATTTSKVSDKANIPIPFTGNYYILNGAHEYEYILVDHVENGSTQTLLLAKGSSLTEGVDLNRRYLSTYPNYYTLLADVDEYYEILLEDGSMMLTEDDNYFINEEERFGLNSIATKTTKVRLGNLDGIQDSTFPKDRQPYGYGLYGLNVFLVGEFYLNNGRSLADISNDAITFAIAARDASELGIYLVSKDIDAAKTTLQRNINALDLKVSNDYYNKADLKTAGILIRDVDVLNSDGTITKKPGMVIWANYLMIATSQAELEGQEGHEPTAMFHHGIIDANLIRLYSIHSKAKAGDPIYYLDTEVVTKDESTGKYYKEDTTELTAEEAARVVEVYKYFKWAINEDGDGYFASNNFSWDKEGNIEIRGMITLGGETDDYATRKNILRVLNSSGEEVVNVGNYSFSNILQWLSENPTQFWNYNVVFDTSYTTIIDKQNLSISNQLCELTLKVSRIQNSSYQYAQFYLQLFNGDTVFTSETVTLQEGGTITLSRNLKSDGEFAGLTITRILILVKKYATAAARGSNDELVDILYPYEIDTDTRGEGSSSGGSSSGGGTALQSTISGYFQARIATTQKTLIGSDFLGVSPDPNTFLWAGCDGLYGIKGDYTSDPGIIRFSGITILSDEIHFAINLEIVGTSDMRSYMSSNTIHGTLTLALIADRRGHTINIHNEAVTNDDYSICKLSYNFYTLRNSCIMIDSTQDKTYIVWIRPVDALEAGYTINLSTLIMNDPLGKFYLCCTNNVKTITYNSMTREVPSWWETDMDDKASTTPTDECTIRDDYIDIWDSLNVHHIEYKANWVKFVPLYVSGVDYSTTPLGIKLMYLGYNKWKLFR